MSRGRPKFRQADVTRLMKAARAAGEQIARVEVDSDGKIVIICGSPATAPTSPTPEEAATERFFAKQERPK